MKKFFRKLNKGLSLSNKLVFMFMALSMVPILIVGLVSANVSSNIVKEKEIEQRMEELELVEKEVIEIVKDIDLAGIRYGLDPNVQRLFSSEESINEYDEIMLQFEIEKLIFENSQKLYYWIDSTWLLSHTGIVRSSESNKNISLDDYYSSEWFADGLQSSAVKFLGDSEKINNNNVIPYVRKIKNVNNNENIGVAIININESIITSTFLTSFSSNTGMNMIVNSNGNVVSHTEKQYIGQNIHDVYGKKVSQMKKGNGYFEYTWAGQKMLVIQNIDEKIGWTYYSIVPLNEILVGSIMINRITIVLMAICVSFCIFISYFLSKRVTKPINKLSGVMREAETGNLDISYSVKHYDEIGKLGDSFNKMIKQLKFSMEETINVQKEKRDAELKGLEFQINPHFLYNTLSSIIWLADEGRNEEVIKMTKSLATFFRISISRGKEIIRVGKEVEHVINYMEIQKLRYGDVTFIHDIDMEIKGYFTLKLLLQPIIENAIYHGVKLLEDKKGIIKLNGYKEGCDLVFLVSDNGNGMTQQRADQINLALSGNQKGEFGVGLQNVNKRIKLHFGKKYGLKFSVKGEFTVVEICVPIMESEEGFDV